MIVTCPSCSSSYKVNESKIKGRGAKITCPRCRQRFVVYRDQQGASIPPDIVSHDFRTLGIVWRVRKGMGVTYSFHDLAGLKEAIHDGQVNHWDSITYDNRNWEPIKDHDPLDAYFWDIWQKAQRGEITIHPPEDEEEDDEEDESDAPTTIVGRGSQLASQISQAVTDAATPAPMDSRDSGYEGAGHLVLDDEDDEDQRTVMHADAMDDDDDDDAEPEMVGATPEPAPEHEAAPPAMMDEGDVDDDELEEDGPAPIIAPENMATDTSAPPRPERPPVPTPSQKPAPAASESGGGLSFGLIVFAFLGKARTTRQNRSVAVLGAIAACVGLRTAGFAVTTIADGAAPLLALLYAVPLTGMAVALWSILGEQAGQAPAWIVRLSERVSALIDQISNRLNGRMNGAA